MGLIFLLGPWLAIGLSQNNCPKWYGANLNLREPLVKAMWSLKITAPNGMGLIGSTK